VNIVEIRNGRIGQSLLRGTARQIAPNDLRFTAQSDELTPVCGGDAGHGATWKSEEWRARRSEDRPDLRIALEAGKPCSVFNLPAPQVGRVLALALLEVGSRAWHPSLSRYAAR